MTSPEPKRRAVALAALAVAALLGSTLLVSLDLGLEHYGIPLDEQVYHEASRRHVAWLLRIGNAGSFSEQTLAEHFAWQPHIVIHPTFSRWMSGCSWLLFHYGLGVDELVSLRLHNALGFGLIALGVVVWTHRRYGTPTALVALLLTWTDVRLFGHAHSGQTDLVLTTTWFWAVLLSVGGLYGGSTAQLLAAALVAGLALSTKMTGVLLVGLLAFWPTWMRGRRGLPASAMLALIPPLVFFASNPQTWHHPIGWTTKWFADMAARQHESMIPSLFLGERYWFHAPWYSPPVHALITTPPALLLLASAAGLATLRRLVAAPTKLLQALREPWALLALAGALPLVASCIPSVPNHDLERLFLPMHPLLVLAAAHGFHVATTWAMQHASDGARRSAWLPQLVLGLFLLAPTTYAAVRAHPYELTYFNALVGGPRGAQDFGFDVAYLKQEFNQQVLDAVDRLVEPDGELWSNFLQLDLRQYQQDHRFRSDIRIVPRLPARYVLVHARRSWMMPLEEDLMKRAGEAIWKLEHQGVVLVALFRMKWQQPAPH